MTVMTLLTILAVFGIRTRYWLIGIVALVVIVALVAFLRARGRRPKFELRDLDAADAERYVQLFAEVEKEFVDRPDQAAARARGIAEEVMRRRGFPDRLDPEQRIRDIGAHDREASSSFRSANEELARAGGDTERLRKAVQHYRAVVYRLAGAQDRAA